MDQNIKKKKKRKIQRWVFVVIPVILVVLFLGLLYKNEITDTLFSSCDAGNIVSKQGVDSEAQNINDTDTSDINVSCIIVDRKPDELFSVYIQPSNDEAYMLAYMDGHLYLDGDTDQPLKEGIDFSIQTYASFVHAEEPVADTSSPNSNTVGLSDFGLDHPSYYAEITYTDGERISLMFGSSIEENGFLYYYMKTDRSGIIYLVSADFYDAFSYRRHAMHPVDSPSLRTDLIDEIDISGEIVFSLRYNKGYWDSLSPVSYPLTDEKVDGLLNRIGNILFSSYIGEKDELDLNEYGLNEPRISVDIFMADTIVEGYDSNEVFYSEHVSGNIHHLLIGKDYNEVSYYCMYDNAVYIATYFTNGFWFDIDPYDFYLQNPVNIPTNALVSVSVENNDDTTVYLFDFAEHVLDNGQIQTDEETGEYIYDVLVYRDGDLISTNDFLSWYGQLTGLSFSGKLNESKTLADGKTPEISFVIKAQDIERKIDLVKEDALNYTVYINGTAVYYISGTKIEVLTKKP
ncbi:MAG: hypothetical protein CW338_11025 [Clostridiales bacterium]|nr:hypothetical protein [Clostridiales bacterium]